MHISVLRHTAVAVERGICYGRSDVPLADSFPEELGAIRKRLPDVSYAGVYTSPSTRCAQLARELSSDIIIDPRLAELDFGEWEMKPWDTITGPAAERWFADYYKNPAPGGESMKEMVARISAFLASIQSEAPEHVLVVTHSGVIRVFYYLLQHYVFDQLFSLDIGFGSLHTFRMVQ